MLRSRWRAAATAAIATSVLDLSATRPARKLLRWRAAATAAIATRVLDLTSKCKLDLLATYCSM
eukprot:6213231-Pleurochrysis_carterae.AAC.2